MSENYNLNDGNGKKGGDGLYKFVGITFGILFLVLIGTCIYQLFRMGDPASRNIAIEAIPKKMDITLQVMDSITDSTMMAQIDSLRTAINTWNDFAEEKLMHGLDDLRQETNNVIDKQNGWLSFWLGVFALVGALLPFLFQLKAQKDQDRIIEIEIDKVKRDINEERKQLTELRNEVVKEFNDFEKLKKEKEKFKQHFEIIQLSNTLITCKENKWGKDHIDRNVLWNDLFANLCHKTSRFIALVAPEKVVNPDDFFLVKTILLQLHAVYCAFIPTCSQSYKSRKLLILTKEIAKILDDMSNNQHDGNSLYQVLSHMIVEMTDFSLK